MVAPDAAIDWLLEPDQPSIRYLALTRLLGRPESDAEVRAAKRRISATGWVADILARRDPGGWWSHEESFYTPKYLSTNWNLLALSDLGVTRALSPVRESIELWVGRAPLEGGGVGGNSKGGGHHCFTANMARALIRFGYAEDRRVRRTLEWLVRTASPKGGWSCWNYGSGPPGRTLDCWEGLSAFAAYPRPKWTRSMTDCVERAAEFYLDRRLHRQGTCYPPWYRFHWPMHYYYDLLVGLDVLTELGYGDDPRLDYALELVRKRRRSDGRWNMDAAHPDVGGSLARYVRAHPNHYSPLLFEPVGEASKMITLRALTVLSRAG